MNREEIFNQVADSISESFEIERTEITEASTLFGDLDLDSIDAIDMAVKMQELTGQRIEESALKDVRTVGDVVSMIERLKGQPS